MTKQELQGYRQIKKEIAELESTIAEMDTRVYSPRIPKLTGMPSAHFTEAGSAQERAATALFELREKYYAEVERLHRTAEQIEMTIELLDDPLQRRILRMRYIKGRSWIAIARKVHYSESYVWKVHGYALKNISKI